MFSVDGLINELYVKYLLFFINLIFESPKITPNGKGSSSANETYNSVWTKGESFSMTLSIKTGVKKENNTIYINMIFIHIKILRLLKF